MEQLSEGEGLAGMFSVLLASWCWFRWYWELHAVRTLRPVSATGIVARLGLLPDAPPAFLIDKYRLAGGAQPSPGTFDNRWVVLPQDFPSGVFLASHGIRGVLLLGPAGWLDGDLAHVLRRWQEAGLPLERLDPASPSRVPVDVPRPSRFRALLYRTGVLFGLRRNAAGGFGAPIPLPSQGGGFG